MFARKHTDDKPHKNSESLTREQVRAKLLAAGALVTDLRIPDGAVRLSDEELTRIGTLPLDTRSSEEILREDRDAG